MWQDNSANEQSFVVQRSLTSTGLWTTVATTAAGVTNATDCALAGGTTYFYRVAAGGAAGNSLPSNVAGLATPSSSNVLALDRASEYSGGWTNGSTGGTGFGVWTLVGAGQNGFFTGSSANNGFGGGVNIDSCGLSFGLFANSGGNAVAYRGLGTPLGVGESLRWRLDNGFVTAGSSVGTVLRTGNATGSVNDYNTGARFEFFFLDGFYLSLGRSRELVRLTPVLRPTGEQQRTHGGIGKTDG